LFGASLGFAQMLVNSRRVQMPRVVTVIRPPDGFTEPVRGYEAIPGAILTGAGRLNGRPRMFLAVSREGESRWTADSAKAEAVYLYEQVLSHPIDEEIKMAGAILGRMPGYQIEGEFGDRDERHFLLQRMAVLPGRVVAICFSGPGRLTDADKEFFDAFCNTRVSIRIESPRSSTTRPQ